MGRDKVISIYYVEKERVPDSLYLYQGSRDMSTAACVKSKYFKVAVLAALDSL
jgi:hypothetical protein